ncbi:hypothetical protein T05_4526, partial [Trichinella murrelli]
LTKKERQYVSRRHSLFYPYFIIHDIHGEKLKKRWYGERLERPLPYLENFMPFLLMRKATFIDNVSQKCSSEIADNLSFTIIFTVASFLRLMTAQDIDIV